MEVVEDVRLNTLPVITSIIVMRYSEIIPFLSLLGGGDHAMLIEVDVTGES